MPSILQSKMPSRTVLQNVEEAEDEVFLVKCEIESMALAEQGGDLNKIRRSRRTISAPIREAGGEEGEEVQEVDEVVRGVEREVEREVERASDLGKQGAQLHVARHKLPCHFLHY